ncbi:short-chain dehydrogenase/reductase [Xylariales sp. PMI_506]|nr:short-chain dehydrogenase/reductase [Xylariales sp. PMI_506]
MPQKSVLITGCSEGGIGAGLAAEFQLRGFRVFATARNVAKMKSLSDKGIETLALDVNSDESIAAAAAAVRAATGGTLDYLINNAGIHHFMPFADSKMEDMRRVLDTNITAVFAVTHAFLPLLIEAKGVVANIGSVQEVFRVPFQSAYNASKAAVHAMAQTLRLELAPLGVRFVTVVTGGVSTNIYDNAPVNLPEDSFYAPIAATIENREFIKGSVKKIPVEDFARRVADHLTKPKPPYSIWEGTSATLAWVLTWFGWDGMLDNYLKKANSITKLSPPS